MGRTSDAKERILVAAAGLFHQQGYGSVGISEVCSAAEVNKGSFYHFFKSKQALALQVVDEYAVLGQSNMAHMRQTDTDPLLRIQALFNNNALYHQQIADETGGCVQGCMFGNLALELSTQDEEVRLRIEEYLAGHADLVANALQEAVQTKQIPPLDVDKMSTQLIALLQGGVLLAKVQRNPEVLYGLAETAMRMIGAPLDPS